MADLRQHTAQEVIERQCEVFDNLMHLRQHSTVQSNPKLREWTDSALAEIRGANMAACHVWFLDEVRPEPPKAA